MVIDKELDKLLERKIQLERELAADRCKDNFYEFCVYMDADFFTPAKWHLKLKAKYLQMLGEQIINKLAISEPPRAGKSYTVSLFHAWIIGKYPEDSSMRNSYAAELAEKFSYNIRDIVQSDKYKKIFPHVELRNDRRAVSDWAITKAKDASYFCAGVGGPILGKGCKRVGTLDDPVKNIEEALSETILEKIWNWYTSTHLSRFESGCCNLHVATRWSKKDPIGRILEDKNGIDIEPYVKKYDDWYVITIPALIDGKSFCEEIKTTEEYMEIKKVTEDFIWEAEYMQNPIESKGLLYPISELKKFKLSELHDKTPDGIIGYVDTADQGTDYLCALVGKRYGDYTYLTDVIFTQEGVEITQPLVAQQIIDTCSRETIVEANNGGKLYADNVSNILKYKIERLKEIGTDESLQQAEKIKGYYVYHKQTTQNKETRILMNAGYVKQYFYFRDDYAPGSDYDKYMRQLTSYVKLGRNKNDDAADCTTGLAEYMQEQYFVPKGKPEIPEGYYTPVELEDMVSAGKITKWQMKEYLKKGVKSW